MEICTRMNSHSGYELDTNSQQQMLSYDCSQLGSDVQMAVPQDIFYNNEQTPSNELKQYEELRVDSNWTNVNVDCKQEFDASGYMDNNLKENSNYGSEDGFEEPPYQYDYSQVTPSCSTQSSSSKVTAPSHTLHGSNSTNQQRMGPYQISSSTKNQLPSWYNPPSTCYTETSGFLQQPYPFYQGGYMGSKTPLDHSMQNMIHMTSRNGREARNRAEKHRRDKLNGSIQELSTMVPHVAESPRRVDKTAVLRFSAHGLRIDYIFANQKPNRYLINPKSTEGLMKLLDTFLITVTCRANIVLISSSVEQYLGHCRSDLYGQSLLNITHPDDHAVLKQQLIPTDLHNLFAAKMDESGEIRSRTQEEEEEIDKKLREDRRDFNIRLARAGPRSEPTAYEVVRIDGCFRRADTAPRGRPTAGPTGLQLIRRARGRDDNIPLHSVSGNDIVLIAMARIVKPPLFRDRLIEACRYEYKTRHLIDGRIVQCDQRISIVAGYLTEEISGLSPFTFIHKDDVRWVMVALRQMYDFGRPFGESCYRLMSRTGQFIYLKTRGCLEVDEKTRQVHSFVCVNSLVSDEEGRRLIREMKKKFSAIISEAELSALESDVPAVENPQKLERAILNLITNLNNQATYDDDNLSTVSDSTTEGDEARRVKSPPLAIIAPKSNTIKNSIFKAVGVISSATKGRSPSSVKDEPKSPEGTVQMNSQRSPSQLSVKPEPLQSLLSPSSSVCSIDSDSSSPFLSGSRAVKSDFNGCKQLNVPLHISTEYFTSHDNSAGYNLDTSNAAAAGNDSASIAYNNNNSSVNRNSVLKRVYNSDDDDYSGLIKKPTLTEITRNQTDLQSSSGKDVSDVLSYPDDSLTDQFRYETSPTMELSDSLDIEQAQRDEQREILESLRETYSVIRGPSRNPADRCSGSDGER